MHAHVYKEGNGEDPLLGHEFGRLYVEGYQNDEGTGVLKALATPKHFDVFSGPGNAPCPDSTHPNNECDVEIGLRDWMTTFQPAFRGAIIGGKARSVMCSYNSINGQPNCGNRHLLTDILRDEWGFDGHVVSDCGGVDHIWAMHHAVPDLSEGENDENVCLFLRCWQFTLCFFENPNICQDRLGTNIGKALYLKKRGRFCVVFSQPPRWPCVPAATLTAATTISR